MKKAVVIISIIMILCGLIAGCEKEPEVIYEDGIIESGKTIRDYYNLSGSEEMMGMSGNRDIVAVTVCEVSTGGYVAWAHGYYSYCKDGSKMNVAAHLAMDVLGLEPYDLDKF